LRGVPLKVSQELMGHVTIKTTERYAHLIPSVLAPKDNQLDEALHLEPVETSAVPLWYGW